MRAVSLLFAHAREELPKAKLPGDFLGLSVTGDSVFFVHGDKKTVQMTESKAAARHWEGMIRGAQEFGSIPKEKMLAYFFEDGKKDFNKSKLPGIFYGLMLDEDFSRPKTFFVHSEKAVVLRTYWADIKILSTASINALREWGDKK